LSPLGLKTKARFATQWEAHYKALQRFARREGHARVPLYHTEDGLNLGSWVGRQRNGRRKGRLDPTRQARLEKVKGWTWNSRTTKWDLAYQRLLRFAKQNGHASVPADYEDRGFNLGHWVGNQRSDYAKGKVPPERQKQLEAVPGWRWPASRDL